MLLYFICRFFDITRILKEVYNAATKTEYFHVDATKSLLHQQLAYLLLKKIPLSNFKMKIEDISIYPRITMQWITTKSS